MEKKLVIIGAGGHGKVVADIAVKSGYKDIVFLDDNATGDCLNFPIVGATVKLKELDDGRTDFVIAVGNNKIRKRIADTYSISWTTLIHPKACLGMETQIGEGTVVMAGAIINPGASVGTHCIVNTGAVIEHDNVLKNYVHVSPNAALGGSVHVGEGTHIGIGAIVKNNIEICSDCVIGAGAVVVHDIKEQGTYVGVPSRKIK